MRDKTMQEECRDHFEGPGLIKRRVAGAEKYPTKRKRWPYLNWKLPL